MSKIVEESEIVVSSEDPIKPTGENGTPVYGSDTYEVSMNNELVLDPNNHTMSIPNDYIEEIRLNMYEVNSDAYNREVCYEKYSDLHTIFNTKYWVEYNKSIGHQYECVLTVREIGTDRRILDIYCYESEESFQGVLTMLLGIYGFKLIRNVL